MTVPRGLGTVQGLFAVVVATLPPSTGCTGTGGGVDGQDDGATEANSWAWGTDGVGSFEVNGTDFDGTYQGSAIWNEPVQVDFVVWIMPDYITAKQDLDPGIVVNQEFDVSSQTLSVSTTARSCAAVEADAELVTEALAPLADLDPGTWLSFADACDVVTDLAIAAARFNHDETEQVTIALSTDKHSPIDGTGSYDVDGGSLSYSLYARAPTHGWWSTWDPSGCTFVSSDDSNSDDQTEFDYLEVVDGTWDITTVESGVVTGSAVVEAESLYYGTTASADVTFDAARCSTVDSRPFYLFGVPQGI
jgi:hypothetical protein